MARGDEASGSRRTALLASLESTKEIRYRQAVYLDCLEPIRRRGALRARRRGDRREEGAGGASESTPTTASHCCTRRSRSSKFVGILKRLHQPAEEHADALKSEGFASFFATLRRELDDAYFGEIGHHLRNLRFRDGVLASARLGTGNQGVDYALRARRNRGNFLRHPIMKGPTFSRTIPRRTTAATKP